MKPLAVLEAQKKGKNGESLYSILHDFCRNAASGKPMPKKNWPKGGNTVIARYPTLSVILHKTCIVETAPDGRITLNSGGYQTVTTKARINEFLDLANTGWKVSQVKGVWHLYHYAVEDLAGAGSNVDVDAIFHDGIAIEPVYSDATADLTEVCIYCNQEIYYKEWLQGQKEWVTSEDGSFCWEAAYDETKGHEGKWHAVGSYGCKHPDDWEHTKLCTCSDHGISLTEGCYLCD